MILADKILLMKFLITIAASLFIIYGCNNSKESLIKVEGEAQGTTWHISYLSADNINYKKTMDSLLKKIDTSMSTYLPVSFISRINKNDSTVLVDQYFIDVLKKSIEVSEKTVGLFDVTVGPLVNAWGFGFSKREKVDSAMIDSLRHFVGYKMIKLEGNKVVKEKPQIKLDFNAIAQGYSVDVLSAYLESKGVNNYLVEIGGELKAKGKKYKDDWKVGIDQPNENATERKLEAVIALNDRALATSGNYRKFYEEGGQKFSHIIDPGTGYPAKQNLLSTTVLADDGITADAYATAFMIMGLERSKQFLSDNKDLKLEVFFIYDENGKWKTYASESLKKEITELN
jgi:thiamine biosynthesis lipoprotein